MIQFSLVSMLELTEKGVFTIEKVVEKMAHAPAQMYEIQNRGFIRKGYQADLVLVRPAKAIIPVFAPERKRKVEIYSLFTTFLALG